MRARAGILIAAVTVVAHAVACGGATEFAGGNVGPSGIASCERTIDPSSQGAAASGGSFLVEIATQQGCDWTAVLGRELDFRDRCRRVRFRGRGILRSAEHDRQRASGARARWKSRGVRDAAGERLGNATAASTAGTATWTQPSPAPRTRSVAGADTRATVSSSAVGSCAPGTGGLRGRPFPGCAERRRGRRHLHRRVVTTRGLRVGRDLRQLDLGVAGQRLWQRIAHGQGCREHHLIAKRRRSCREPHPDGHAGGVRVDPDARFPTCQPGRRQLHRQRDRGRRMSVDAFDDPALDQGPVRGRPGQQADLVQGGPARRVRGAKGRDQDRRGVDQAHASGGAAFAGAVHVRR